MIIFSRLIKGLVLALILIGALNINVGGAGKFLGDPSQGVALRYAGNEAFAADGDAAPEAAPPTADQRRADAADAAQRINTARSASTQDSLQNQLLEKVNNFNFFDKYVFDPVINFITFRIGAFLTNDLIVAGGMGDMLHSIWLVSRNIVNVAFVIILLYLAMMHIFRGENADIAKTLPAFAIALIAINFTWLAGTLVLDASTVVTNIAFSIPSGIQGIAGRSAGQGTEPCKINESTNTTSGSCIVTRRWYPADAAVVLNFPEATCSQMAGGASGWDAQYKAAYPSGNKSNTVIPGFTDVATVCWDTGSLAQYTQNTASYFPTYAMARVQNLGKGSLGAEPGQVAVGLLFSLTMKVVYILAFVALFVALVLRMAWLWILMAFSPFIALIYYLGKANLGGMAESAKKYLSIENFLKWAFLPTKVAVVWAVGFIMVSTGQAMTGNNTLGAIIGQDANTQFLNVSSLFGGINSLDQFIWLIITTAVIWFGTFAALSDLGVGQMAVTAIQKLGTGIVKGGGGLVLEKAPIIPVYDSKTGKISTQGVSPFVQEALGKYGLRGGGGGAGSERSITSQHIAENLNKIDSAKYSTIVSSQNYGKLKAQLVSDLKINEETFNNNSQEIINQIRNSDKFKKEDREIIVKVLERKTWEGISAPAQAETPPAGPAAANLPASPAAASPAAGTAPVPQGRQGNP